MQEKHAKYKVGKQLCFGLTWLFFIFHQKMSKHTWEYESENERKIVIRRSPFSVGFICIHRITGGRL